MRYPSAVALLAVVALATPASAQTSPTASAYMLAPGDSVRVVVWRRPDFSGDFVVAPNGTITHPLYRSVTVGGVPFATAEANLRRFLSRFEENPEFVMEPLVRVSVSGEVDRPQVYALRRDPGRQPKPDPDTPDRDRRSDPGIRPRSQRPRRRRREDSGAFR
jgi:protein involved in polysaccharide export with SLBB domain